jgi:alpha-glucosidase
MIFLLVGTSLAQAQHQKMISAGNAQPVQTENGLVFKAPNCSVQITVYNPAIIRVHFTHNSIPDTFSYAVVQKAPGKKQFTINESTGKTTLKTDSMYVEIQHSPLRIRFLTLSGQIINEDEPAFGTAWIGEEVTTYKKLQPGEKFIGLGEKTGSLNRRGEGYTNWNTDYYGYPTNADPIYMTTPFYMGLHSAQGKNLIYGIFLDNSYKTHFNFGASNDRFSSFTAEDGDMNYYFIHSSTVAGIIEHYTALTGRMDMPPLWSLGFQQCRYSYYPDKEVLRIAETFREKSIPADVIYLDIHYMDKYKIFTWDNNRFPDPPGMIKSLQDKGFRTAVIIDPGIKVEKGYAAYEQGVKDKLFLKYPDGTDYTGAVWPGWCHFPDFTNPSTRNWWGNSFKGYIQAGIRGFWNDMNEPASWGQRFPDLVEFNFEGNTGTHRKGHNLYGMQMARATYEGTRQLLQGERPFILTRAGFSGIQRYSSVWTGDNVSSDDHMMLGVRLLNSMGLTGIPFTGMDIGGFSGNPSKELFARWISIGAFSGLCRAHVCVDNKDQEPWSFGEKVEDIARNYISLRYMLLPYIYSAFYQAHRTGLPIWRSLAIYHPFDDKIYDGRYQHQFMLGNGLMIAPVNSQQEFAKVYLPDSTWYDFYNDKLYAGKEEILTEAPLEKLPVFVKGGSILSMQSLIQHTGQKPTDTLYMHVYRGNNGGTAEYYEDDGLTYAYEKGAYHSRIIRYVNNTLTVGAAQGNASSKFKFIRIIFHGFSGLEQISVNNREKLQAQRNQISFMRPLSNFDPLGGAGQPQMIDVYTVTISNSQAETKLSW